MRQVERLCRDVRVQLRSHTGKRIVKGQKRCNHTNNTTCTGHAYLLGEVARTEQNERQGQARKHAAETSSGLERAQGQHEREERPTQQKEGCSIVQLLSAFIRCSNSKRVELDGSPCQPETTV